MQNAVLKEQQINNINEFLFLISVLIYRTQKSEIHGYLELFYNESFNQRLNKIENSEHYKYYLYLYKDINNLLKKYNKFQKKYKNEIKYILEKLKNIQKDTLIKKEKYPDELFNATYNCKHVLLFWKKRISYFLKTANKIFNKYNVDQ